MSLSSLWIKPPTVKLSVLISFLSLCGFMQMLSLLQVLRLMGMADRIRVLSQGVSWSVCLCLIMGLLLLVSAYRIEVTSVISEACLRGEDLEVLVSVKTVGGRKKCIYFIAWEPSLRSLSRWTWLVTLGLVKPLDHPGFGVNTSPWGTPLRPFQRNESRTLACARMASGLSFVACLLCNMGVTEAPGGAGPILFLVVRSARHVPGTSWALDTSLDGCACCRQTSASYEI